MQWIGLAASCAIRLKWWNRMHRLPSAICMVISRTSIGFATLVAHLDSPIYPSSIATRHLLSSRCLKKAHCAKNGFCLYGMESQVGRVRESGELPSIVVQQALLMRRCFSTVKQRGRAVVPNSPVQLEPPTLHLNLPAALYSSFSRVARCKAHCSWCLFCGGSSADPAFWRSLLLTQHLPALCRLLMRSRCLQVLVGASSVDSHIR